MAIIATSSTEAILSDTRELTGLILTSNHDDDEKWQMVKWANCGITERDAEELTKALQLNQRSLQDIAVPSQKEIKEMVKEIVNRDNT